MIEKHLFQPRGLIEGIAEHSALPVYWSERKREAVREMIFNAPKNEVLLGAHDDEFSTEPVTIPYDGRSFSCTVLGVKGSGKTNMLSVLLNQLHLRFGHPMIICDPKWEYFSSQMPNRNAMMNERLQKYGLSSQALPVFLTTPFFIIEPEEKNVAGYVYQLDLDDFKRIRKLGERYKILTEFFNIEGSRAGESTIFRWINKLPDSFNTWLELLSNESREIVAGSGRKRIGGTALLDTLNSLKMSGAIGSGLKLYIPRMMQRADGSIGDVVVLQLSLEGDSVSACYLKLALFDIIQDRIRAKKLGKGFLKKPPVIAIDEVDVYCPNNGNPPAKKLIEQLNTKYRIWDVFSLFATQKPQYTSEKIVSDVDYVITTKLQTTGERSILRAKGLTDDDLKVIFDGMKYERHNPVKEMALIEPSGEYKTFFGLPSPHELVKETRFMF